MMNKEKLNDTCVYFHINPLKNHIFYVGIGYNKRAYEKHGRSKFWYDTVNKYGYIVDVCHENLSWEEACKLERLYIKKIGRRDLGLGILVNLTDGGEGRMNVVTSEETREKMSKARLGKKLSEKTKLKMKEVKTGKNNSRYGTSHTNETKNQMSISHQGKKLSNETKQKMSRIIIQTDLEGNFIKEWNSIISALKELNMSSGSIGECLRGKNKTAGGYKWEYKQTNK